MSSTTSQKSCPTCKGTGLVTTPNGQQWQQCPNCNGTGAVKRAGLFYTYAIPTTALNALQTKPVIITIVNWDFLWLELTGDSIGAYTLQIQDVGDTRNFSPPGTPISNADIVGTGQNPFPLLTPYTFAKQSQIQITLTDTSNAGNSVNLCFIGENLGESVNS